MSSSHTNPGLSLRSTKFHFITLAALGVVFGDIVRDVRAARRQQRRRRRAGLDGAVAALCRLGVAAREALDDAGRLRRLHVLWRRRHHAGHLGAVGRGRPGDRRAADGACGHPAHLGDRGDPVPDPAAWHQRGGPLLRTGDVPVVLLAGAAGRLQHRQGTRGAGGDQPVLRRALHGRAFAAGLHCPGLGGAGADRGRGAVCRHGPLRHQADPLCVALYGHALAPDQLLRPGGQPDRQSQGHRQSLLPDDPRAAGAAHGAAGHLRYGDRLAGRDLGGLLADQPGHPAGLRAAHAHPAYLRG
ncbi:hypothetical protein Lal_00007072 [Lupinus albus]|nr:hypothetical protein Lal_00007072 [Lupinus albus]